MNDMQGVFDYGILEASQAVLVKQVAGEIHAAAKRSADTIKEIGDLLLGVKEIIPHGQWEAWLETEFQWSDRTARNFMRVAETFKTETVSDLGFGARVLYELSAPSTPEPVRAQAIEMAKAGIPVTQEVVKKLKVEHREKTQQAPPPVQQQMPVESEPVYVPEEAPEEDDDEGDPEPPGLDDADFEMMDEPEPEPEEEPEQEDLDPQNLEFAFVQAREWIQSTTVTSGIDPPWRDYTKVQIEYLLPIVEREMNYIINAYENILELSGEVS